MKAFHARRSSDEEKKLGSYGTSRAFCATAAGALCRVREAAGHPAAGHQAGRSVCDSGQTIGLEGRCLRQHGVKSGL
jgi:hypothetical protein